MSTLAPSALSGAQRASGIHRQQLESESPSDSSRTRVPVSRRFTPSPAACWLLALTTTSALLWSRVKLLGQDEIFVLQTDSVRTLRELIHVQRRTPVSLDPLAYHLAGFVSLHAFQARTPAAQAFALRLPSLLGFLLLQVCLYLFVRRSLQSDERTTSVLTSERAALLALLFPALTASLFYAAEARPYGFLLGLCGLSLVSWQSAARACGARRAALCTFAVSLALALNTHYFAVLLLLPFAAAEAHRLCLRRCVDWSMLLALLAGAAGAALTVPFQRGAAEFRAHYYNADAVTPHSISQAYRALLLDYTGFAFAKQHWLALVLALAAILFGTRLLFLMQSDRLPGWGPERTALLALAALPFAGFLLGRLVTHSFEVRYVLCALAGLSGLLVFALEGALRKRAAYQVLLWAGVVLLLGTSVWHATVEGWKAREYRARLDLPPGVRHVLASLDDQHVYLQNIGQCEPALLYAPDPAVRERLVLLYSREEELRWDRHDTAALTATHLRQFANVPVVAWPDLQAGKGPYLLILFHSGWDWTDQALKTSGAESTPLGPAMGGDAVLVRWK